MTVCTMQPEANATLSGSKFRIYRVEEGLSQNTVWCSLQDKFGYIWTGTKDGLNRFDGISFKVFRNNPSDDTSIGNNFIRALYEDPNEDLIYVGTDNGLFLYRQTEETFTRLIPPGTERHKQTAVNSIVTDNDGDIWIGVFGYGIYVFNTSDKSWRHISADSTFDSLNSNLVWKIFKDSEGTMWVGTLGGGLSRYNAASSTFRNFGVESNLDNDIYDIYEDHTHNLWIGTWSRGLMRLDRSDNTFKECVPANVCEAIRCIYQTEPGVLTIGGNSGLFEYDMTSGDCKPITIDSDNSRTTVNDGIYSILEDREGGLWIGGYFAGLNYTHPRSNIFVHFNLARECSSASGNVVGQMIEDCHHNIWAATEDNGLAYFDIDNNTTSFLKPPAISHSNLHALMMNGKELWVGNIRGGIDVVDTDTKKVIRKFSGDHGLMAGSVHSIFKSRDGSIYVGGIQGLFQFDPLSVSFHRVDGFPHTAFVYDIAQDKNGMIWFATYGDGIFIFNPMKKTWKNHLNNPRDPATLRSNKIICLHIDSDNTVWAGTEGGGVSVYDRRIDRFHTISELEGLPNNVIYGILSDHQGGHWMSSNQGIACLYPGGDSIRHFAYTDGLQGSQFNYKSFLRMSDGTLCFGGIDGVNLFNPDNITPNTTIPQVVISNCYVRHHDGSQESICLMSAAGKSMTKTIDLYDINTIKFDFAALSFINPQKNMYAFRLKGVDADWQYSDGSTQPSYYNLKPGHYEFEVRGANSDGVWNSEIAKVELEIHPPIYRTTTAYIIYMIALLGFTGWIFNIFKVRRERQRQIRELNFERDRQQEYYESQLSFFTNMAHEIRTPLSLINAPLEEIYDLYPDDAEYHEAVDIMKDNTQRLMVLVNQLLDFRKLPHVRNINFSKVDVSELINKTVQRFRSLAKRKGIEIYMDLPAQPLVASSDYESVTKIVSNLMFNALKYTTDKIKVKLRGTDDENNFSISVIDNGKGIPESQKDKIFTLFYRVTSDETIPVSGSGIGLAIVKKLVDLLKGEVKVSDNTPMGSIFTVTLPSGNIPVAGYADCHDNNLDGTTENGMSQMSDDDNAMCGETTAGTQPEETSENQQGQKAPYKKRASDSNLKRILVVEDNEEMRNFLVKRLRSEYEVMSAENGKIALGILNDQEFDLVVSDVIMAELDGIELCKSIKGNPQWSHINIILLTACTEDAVRLKGLEVGADAYIEKPFSMNLLKTQIENIFSNQSRLRQSFIEYPWFPYKALANSKADEEFLISLSNVIEKYIEDVDFDIDRLACEMNMSRSSLHRKIKAITNMTPNDYLRLYRLKKAAALLGTGEYKVAEVCYMVGFNTHSYFSKCFLAQFGISPRDFLAKVQ